MPFFCYKLYIKPVMFDDSLTDLILYPLEFERLADVVISLTPKTLQIMFTAHTFSFKTSLPYFQNHQVKFPNRTWDFSLVNNCSWPWGKSFIDKGKTWHGQQFLWFALLVQTCPYIHNNELLCTKQLIIMNRGV